MTIRLLDFPIEITNRDQYPSTNFSWTVGPDLAPYIDRTDTAADVVCFFANLYVSASVGVSGTANTNDLTRFATRKYGSGDSDLSEQFGHGAKFFVGIPVKYEAGQLLFEWNVSRHNTASASLLHIWITGYATNDSMVTHDNKVMVNTAGMAVDFNTITAAASPSAPAAGVLVCIGNSQVARMGVRKYGATHDNTQRNFRAGYFVCPTDASNRYQAWADQSASTRVKELGYFLSAAPIEWYDPPVEYAFSATGSYSSIALTAAVGAFFDVHHSASTSSSTTFDIY